ncbi:DNA/RNA helicase domain-containing protein [Ramlibacter albus]|uniref:DNA/RNA helicase domain-containing protein n=1 Tax=Ramlibacter albus TaxID=2079448 RepID=UPI001C9A3495
MRSAAKRVDAVVHEYELEAQFRCSGSDGFINWVENTLDVRRTANVLWNRDDPYEFKIEDSIESLEAWVRDKSKASESVRLVAGFCWPWSEPRPDGTLVPDVKLGNWSMPWNAKPDAGRLARDIPKSTFWPSDPNGLGQVGCVYTAQGFEFDYVGIIFGPDLRYDWEQNAWIGDPSKSFDRVLRQGRDAFVDLVKNTYRVLFTRGIKGCHVYFMDEGTRRFVQSRLE